MDIHKQECPRKTKYNPQINMKEQSMCISQLGLPYLTSSGYLNKPSDMLISILACHFGIDKHDQVRDNLGMTDFEVETLIGLVFPLPINL